MILDEPTSHLDAILENELEESLAKLHANRTCLIIAHRKATAISADQVVYMQNGFVAGFGKHDDLMISSISYAQLFGDRS
jgi:ABC-type transport system involved in cytochrome bd biosynthesis fused ATPase/permease subunit